MSHHRKPDDFIEDAKARQRNIVFPDTVRNGRCVDAFLWKGSPNPPLVQRVAAWLLGVFFLFAGLAFWNIGARRRENISWALDAISLAIILLGIRVFRNGFPKK
jgi:hypothetical protein